MSGGLHSFLGFSFIWFFYFLLDRCKSYYFHHRLFSFFDVSFLSIHPLLRSFSRGSYPSPSLGFCCPSVEARKAEALTDMAVTTGWTVAVVVTILLAVLGASAWGTAWWHCFSRLFRMSPPPLGGKTKVEYVPQVTGAVATLTWILGRSSGTTSHPSWTWCQIRWNSGTKRQRLPRLHLPSKFS